MDTPNKQKQFHGFLYILASEFYECQNVKAKTGIVFVMPTRHLLYTRKHIDIIMLQLQLPPSSRTSSQRAPIHHADYDDVLTVKFNVHFLYSVCYRNTWSLRSIVLSPSLSSAAMNSRSLPMFAEAFTQRRTEAKLRS